MALLTNLKGSDESDKSIKAPSRTVDDGPPASSTKAKPATPKGSLFQQSSRGLADQNSLGLGAEGSDPQIIANKALAGILSNVKILSTVLPGIVPVLSDLTGRLLMIVPQMMNDVTNGGTGLVPSMGMPLPQPTPGAPPAGAPMGAPPPSPMGGGGMPPGMPPMGGPPVGM